MILYFIEKNLCNEVNINLCDKSEACTQVQLEKLEINEEIG